jgi:hypothetical protein
LAVKLQECGNAENSWGSKSGVPDTSQLGNYQRMWRNVTLDSKHVAYLGNWSIPEEGVLEFDYVSLLPVDLNRIESLGMTVMEDSTCYRLKRELSERFCSNSGKDTLLWLYVSLCEQKLQITCQQSLFLASTLPPLLQTVQDIQSLPQESDEGEAENGSTTKQPSRPVTSASSSSSSSIEAPAPVTRVDILHVCYRCIMSSGFICQ